MDRLKESDGLEEPYREKEWYGQKNPFWMPYVEEGDMERGKGLVLAANALNCNIGKL